MDPADDDITFYKSCELPLNLNAGTSPLLRAVIEPDRLVTDPDLANNTASVPMDIQPPTLPDEGTDNAARIVSLSVHSEFGDGVAKAGANLTLRAQVAGGGGRSRITYAVNGAEVDVRGVTTSKSGTATQLSANWHVPWESTGLLRVSARLDNGAFAVVPVRVVPFEYSVLPGSVTWRNRTDTLNYIPGESLYFTAKILRDNRNTFTDNFGALRAHFLINGQLSPGLKVDPPSGTIPYLGDVTFMYPVPDGQTGPLDVRVMVDAGGLLQEEHEDNNAVSLIIPQAIPGVPGNNLSIFAGSLACAPGHAVPGEKVELIATIRNNAATVPTGGVKVLFKVNGTTINASDTARPASSFRPGQAVTVCKMWEVPQDTTQPLTFSVELDPEKRLTGDPAADNIATTTIPLAQPDLLVEPTSLVANGNLLSGGTGRLHARVLNAGAVFAPQVTTVFLMNGVEAGRQTVDLPPYGMLSVSVPCVFPALPSLSDTAVPAAAAGYLEGQADWKQVTWSVRIDPDNRIAEQDETNNLANGTPLQVLVPASRGTVYAKAEDLQGNKVAGATVLLTTGSGTAGTGTADTGAAGSGTTITGTTISGTTISGTTGSDGWCTFSHIPFGPYTLQIAKTGYQSALLNTLTLFAGDRLAYETLYLDNRSFLSGVVSGTGGTPLPQVRVDNLTHWKTDRTAANGSYALRLTPGTHVLRFFEPGYATETREVQLPAGASRTLDIQLTPSTRFQVSGTAVDAAMAPIPGLAVTLVDGNRGTLATATTNASGDYVLTAALPQKEMWVGVTATHAGQGRSYPLYAYQGQEQDCNLWSVAVPDPVTAAASGECHVAPYVVCASMPGTFWNPDYEVEAIYGMFDLALFTTIENGVLNHVDVDTTPQWWVSATVSSSWDPSELFGYGQLVPGYPILTALLPLSVPLAIDMHSANRTMVRIRKVSVTSGGQEVYAAWPDAIGDYVCAPNTAVDWNNCRIKLYLKADPDNGVVNPAAGYNLARVLVEFNPATKKFTKVGNYQVIGWDENLAREIYMDE
jgi:hypothetical protein